MTGIAMKVNRTKYCRLICAHQGFCSSSSNLQSRQIKVKHSNWVYPWTGCAGSSNPLLLNLYQKGEHSLRQIPALGKVQYLDIYILY